MGAASPLKDSGEWIIFFDGVCNLCTGSVHFILKRDPQEKFKFASLQSRYAELHLQPFGFTKSQLSTIVLLKDNQVYTKSDAALEIVRHLTFPWSMFYGLKIIPTRLRNFVYDRIAGYRYRWFGKMDHCMVPTPEIAKRFVD